MNRLSQPSLSWTERVPSNWKITKIKYVCDIVRGGSPRPIDEFLSEDPTHINWVRISDTTKGYKYIDSTELKIIPAGASRSRYIKPGTLLLTNSMSFGQPYIMNIYGCIHDGWLAFSNYKMIEKEFLFYLLMSQCCIDQFEWAALGAVVENLSIDKVGGVYIAIPPVSEQKLIVKQLDEVCSRTDSIIETIEQQISVLKAHKRSLLTEAVTKGIDRTAKMKESGIWVGQIPDGWEISKIKYLVDESHPYPIGDGDHGMIKADDYLMEGIPYIRVLNLTWGYGLSMENIVYIDETMNEKIKNSELRPKDILIAKTGATIGKTAIVPEWMPRSNTTSHVGKITLPETLCPEFFYHQMNSDVIQKQIEDLSAMQSTRPELGIEGLKNLMVIVPPLEVQIEIANYLDNCCAKIDGIIKTKQKQLEQIKDYRKSLIYEYVTGNKRVKGVV